MVRVNHGVVLMTCVRIADGFVCVNDNPVVALQVGERTMRFRKGLWPGCPWVLRKDGNYAVRQPGARHPFWTAFGAWQARGERIDESGNAILTEAK